MSMQPQEMSPVPEETAQVAHAANPHSNMVMSMHDELGSLYEDQMFAALCFSFCAISFLKLQYK